MSRITKIQGTFMGVPFEVKPTPIALSKKAKALDEMAAEWYKENKPDFYEKFYKDGELQGDKLSDDDITAQDLIDLQSWKSDVEFRAMYLEAKANLCMKFSKPVTSEIWASDDLEISTIEEAWDFFTSRRIAT